jgi:hypothetical protein
VVLNAFVRIVHVVPIKESIAVEPHVDVLVTEVTDHQQVLYRDHKVAIVGIKEVSQTTRNHQATFTVDVDQQDGIHHLAADGCPRVSFQVKVQIAQGDVTKLEHMVAFFCSREIEARP